MKIPTMGTTALAFVVLICGCSSPKTPNATNFTAAFKDYAENRGSDKGRICFLLPDYDPKESKVQWTSLGKNPSDNSHRVQIYDALSNAGNLSPVKKSYGHQGFFDTTTYSYEMRPQGRQLLTSEENKNVFGEASTSHSLCVGKLTLDKVVRWTEPSEIMGKRITEVTYRVHLADIPKWAHDPRISKVQPRITKFITGPYEVKHAATLTNEGWRIE